VEFDAASQWYNASTTIAAGWLKTGGKIHYYAFAQSPETVRNQLVRLGIDTEEFEKNGALEIWDWYTTTLGQMSKEKRGADSLKVADLSIHVSQVRMRGPPAPDTLAIGEDISVLDRFNEEKSWVEYELARSIPAFRVRKITCLRGVIRDVHSSLVYKRLESVSDGIIDFKIETESEETVNMIRIKTMRNVGFDSRWHRLRISHTNFEVTLEE
jgi:KaiC/GvpD/RAD55 family RecA-like ATPase